MTIFATIPHTLSRRHEYINMPKKISLRRTHRKCSIKNAELIKKLKIKIIVKSQLIHARK